MTSELQAAAATSVDAAPAPAGGRVAWWVRAACVAIVVGYVVWVLSPLFGAKFAAADDHEILRLVGPDHKITLKELPGLLKEWVPEKRGRLRPVYYTLRVLETMAWGPRPGPWYATRVVLASLVAVGVYLTAELIAGPVAGVVAALLFFAASHTEVWARLGPAEAYAIPLMVAGLAMVVRAVWLGRYRPRGHVVGLLLALSASLSKESFIAVPGVLAGLYVLWPAWVWTGWVPPEQRRWRRSDWVAAAAVYAGIAAIVVTAALKVKWYGHVYDGHVSWENARNWATYTLGLMGREAVWYAVPVVAAAVLLVTRPRDGGAVGGRARDLGRLALAIGVAAALLFPPQMFFYGSSPVREPRYLVPAWVFVPACAVAGFYAIRRRVDGRWWRAAAYAPALAWVAWALVADGTMFHARYANWAWGTRDFQRRVAKVVGLARQHPEMPLVFHVDTAEYFEPVLSTGEFVSFGLPVRYPRRDFFLKVEGDRTTGRFDPNLRADLMKWLRTFSADGGFRFSPLSKLKPTAGRQIHVLYMTSDSVPEGPTVVKMTLAPWGGDDRGRGGEWDMSDGLGPFEDQANGPAVRWGFAPGTRLTVSSNGRPDYRLDVEAAAAPGGGPREVTVLLDGTAVETFALPAGGGFVTHSTPLPHPRPGAHQVELRYGGGGGGGAAASPATTAPTTRPTKAVCFRKLALVRIPAPPTTRPAKR